MFLYNSDIPGFRKKYNYTLTKNMNMYELSSTFLCEC